MICKNCGYEHSSVVYTKHNERKNLTERRRECLKCARRFTTHEQYRVPKEQKLQGMLT